MQTLSLHKVRLLMRTVEKVYAAESLAQFPGIVFNALGGLTQGKLLFLGYGRPQNR
jgi:hypothetical protein